jgi:N-acetylmuramic acid 6-phosphate etherase
MPADPQGSPFSQEQPYGSLETEKINAATREIDRMSSLEIVEAMNAEDAKVAEAVRQALPQVARAIEAIAARLKRGGRLIYMGAGTSGRLGALDAAECPPTFSLPPEMIVGCMAGGSFALTQAAEDVEDSAEAGREDVARLNVTEADAVVGITASGRTAYVLGGIASAKVRGALTIGLACNAGAPLEEKVEVSIVVVVGPEVISGSTRLKAGTAQKMVLNMLSTGAMILLGKTYGNLMVDVQATNRKLHQRALSIIRQVTGLDGEAAEQALTASHGEVKTAIVSACANLTPDQARAHLARHDGILRVALEALL